MPQDKVLFKMYSYIMAFAETMVNILRFVIDISFIFICRKVYC